MTKRSTTALCLAIAACATEPADHAGHHEPVRGEVAPHWTYEGDGDPRTWGSLSAEFATCSLGVEQSPIDLPAEAAGGAPALASVHGPTPLRFTFNGHTVQFDGAGAGGITVDGQAYELVQFHVHFPSEHRAAGRSRPGEIHFVHADSTGRLAVVGVFIAEGEQNEALEPAVEALDDLVEGEPATADGSVDPDDLIGSGTYRAYDGSLTTPPCSENVSWFVMDSPLEMSAGQIAAFSSLVGVSNRPVQPLGERAVTAGSL